MVDPAVERLDENLHYSLHFHVPIDDFTHWKYRIMFRVDGPVDPEFLARTQNDFTSEDSFERPRAARNRYMQNRDEQHSRTFTGMGRNFQDHDRFAVESQGRVLDRTTEHLATTDKALIAMRRQMLAAIETVRNGGDPLMTRTRKRRIRAAISCCAARSYVPERPARRVAHARRAVFAETAGRHFDRAFPFGDIAVDGTALETASRSPERHAAV